MKKNDKRGCIGCLSVIIIILLTLIIIVFIPDDKRSLSNLVIGIGIGLIIVVGVITTRNSKKEQTKEKIESLEITEEQNSSGNISENITKEQDKIMSKHPKTNDDAYWKSERASEMSKKYIEMMDDVDIAPYWQYISPLKRNTPLEHLLLHGTIRLYNDSFWEKWFPPNDLECECDVRSLSAAYLKANGLQTGSGALTIAEALANLKAVKEKRENRLNKIDSEEEKNFLKMIDNKIEELNKNERGNDGK